MCLSATPPTTVEADPNAAPYEYRDPRAPARGEGEGFVVDAGWCSRWW